MDVSTDFWALEMTCPNENAYDGQSITWERIL
jgi:hypothetical protein